MPNDTKYIVNGAQLTDIGDAIRSKLGEQDTYTVDEMPEKISEIGSSTKIVYIPEQTVTTQRYGRDTFYAVLNDVNIDLNNPPSTFTLKVDNDEYEMEKYDSGSSLISYRHPGSYYIYYDADYATESWVISDSQAVDYATFTVYAEGDSGGGSIENPVLTITFNNTLSGEAGKPYYYTIDNNQLIKMFKALPGNTETVFNTLVPIYRSEGEEDFAGWQCDSLASILGTITASNEVNCSLDYTANTVCRIWLDDPTEDASITLTFTNP